MNTAIVFSHEAITGSTTSLEACYRECVSISLRPDLLFTNQHSLNFGKSPIQRKQRILPAEKNRAFYYLNQYNVCNRGMQYIYVLTRQSFSKVFCFPGSLLAQGFRAKRVEKKIAKTVRKYYEEGSRILATTSLFGAFSCERFRVPLFARN